jgi:hypothetical protein
MKKGIVVLLAVCAAVLIAGCNEKLCKTKLTGTFLSSPNEFEETDVGTEYVVRGGVLVENTEIGVAGYFWPEGNDTDPTYGVYALQYLTDPNGLPIIGRPYAGALATFGGVNDNGNMFGFVTGTIINVAGVDVRTEMQFREYKDALAEEHDSGSDEYKVYVGLDFPF